jgi:hypothetical protein
MPLDELDRLLDKPIEPKSPIDYFLKSYQIFVKQTGITYKSLVKNSKKIELIVSNRLMNADPLIPIAAGRSKILSADYFGKCLINLGISVEEPRDALNIEKYKNPVPFAISTSGKKREVNVLVEKFKKYGLDPLAMTADANSDLAKQTKEEDLILMDVPTEAGNSNSYDIGQFFGSKEELKKYCPLGALGEWTSHLTSTHLIGALASSMYSLYPTPTLYANTIVRDIYRCLVENFPIIRGRREQLESISRSISESDFFGTVGEEFSSHVVQSFGMRIKQLIPEGEKRKREVHVFNSDKSNPLYSPRFFDKHKKVTILANSGRGAGYAKNIVEIAKTLRSRPETMGEASVECIGMTFMPNSYIHRECDKFVILPNRFYPLSNDGTTILRSYEPLSIVFTDSLVPLIASYEGIPPEKIDYALSESHNRLE